MEEIIRDVFQLKKRDVREIPALNLAFLGDSVFELIVRTYMAEGTGKRPNELSRLKNQMVNARAQAEISDVLQEDSLLTDEEEAVFRRGRNASPASVARHAALSDYHKATGLECLIGYLYMDGKTERAVQLVKAGLDRIGGPDRGASGDPASGGDRGAGQ